MPTVSANPTVVVSVRLTGVFEYVRENALWEEPVEAEQQGAMTARANAAGQRTCVRDRETSEEKFGEF